MTDDNNKIEGTIENWENGTLGEDERFARLADLSVGDMEQSLGLKSISIRLDASLIEDFKLISGVEGLNGYQPLMRRVLQRFADCQLKDYARQDILARAKQAELDKDNVDPDDPPRKHA